MDLSKSNGLQKRNGDQLDPQLIPQFGAPIGMVPGTGTGAGTGTGSPFPLWPSMPNLSNPMAESFNPSILNQSTNKFPFSGVLPPGLPSFPSEPGFIERAARLSCFSANGNFSGLMNNSVLNPSQKGELNSMSIGSGSNHANQLKNQGNVEKYTETNEGAEDRISSGDNANADSSQNDSGSKKRKRTNQDAAMEQGQSSMKSQEEAGKQTSEGKKEVENNGSKNTGMSGKEAADPKGDYIHVRARRGQATNSHSLAERVRREKISERMKYLQELVPGCSKVTGKAVMLDEIINYVQSLQRQVEFLSMKLAAVNPRLDLNIEALLSKDVYKHILQRGVCSSTVGFTHEMFHSQLHPSQPGLLPPGLPGMLNPTDPFRRAMNNPLSAINAFKDPTHQMPSSWQDELHNVMSMNYATNAPLNTQEVATKPGEGFQL